MMDKKLKTISHTDDTAHVFDRACPDGHEDVRQMEKEVAVHHRPFHLTVGLVPFKVQGHRLSDARVSVGTPSYVLFMITDFAV